MATDESLGKDWVDILFGLVKKDNPRLDRKKMLHFIDGPGDWKVARFVVEQNLHLSFCCAMEKGYKLSFSINNGLETTFLRIAGGPCENNPTVSIIIIKGTAYQPIEEGSIRYKCVMAFNLHRIRESVVFLTNL